MDIAGKTALVLGSIKGIGKGIALALCRAGAGVALNYCDWEEELASLQGDLAAAGGDHLLLKTDLRQVGDVDPMVRAVIKRFGRLDILINNIERGGWPVVHGAYTCEQWDLEIETTLRAKRWVFAAALPHLRASGDGAVINLSSIAALIGRT
ncbi:MAG: SDR family NAD(P)-dependent oxidoreductase, partial [Desulfobacterales bacterium]